MNTNKLTGDYTGGAISRIRQLLGLNGPGFRSVGLLDPLSMQNEENRIRHAQRLYDFYVGDYQAIAKHVEKALARTFTADDINEFQILYFPVFKRIIDKICAVYKSGVWRTLDTDSATAKLDELYEQSDILIKQREWFRAAKAFDTILVRPVVRKVNGKQKLEYDILTPNNVTVIPREDNYLKASLVSYAEESVDGVKTVVWTDTEHYLLDQNGGKIAVPGNEQMVNPYGMLPFEELRVRSTDDFWGEGQSILCNVDEKVAILCIQLMDLLIMQSHGQPVVTNARLEGDVVTGPKHPMVLIPQNPEQQAGFAFVSPDARIKDVQDAIDWIITKISVLYGLSRSSESGESQAASGYAKLLDNWDLMEQRAEDVEVLKDFEKRLYFKTQLVANYDMNAGLPEEGFGIEFDEYDFPVDPQTDIATKKEKMELGLWTPVDDLMEADSSLTKEEAKAILRENLAIRNELKDAFGLFTEEVDGIRRDTGGNDQEPEGQL